MSFLPFALTASALLAGLVVVAAWTWRASSAPLAAKIALPTLMLAAALYLPWTFAAMLGRPVPIAPDDLPNGAQLLALKMFDNDSRAQVWLSENGSTRLYEIAVDPDAKQELRKAKRGVAGGDGVTIRTEGRGGKPNGLYAKASGGFHAEIISRTPEKSGE